MSRFAYYTGDEPQEGGVRSVAKPGTSSKGTPRSSGLPGPEDALLDISEMVRTVGMRYTHRFALPPAMIPELNATTPIVGEATLTNTGAALLLTGDVSATLEMECARCLQPTEQDVACELEESFDLITTNTAYQHEEVKVVDENVEASVIEGTVLNLGDLLRQNLLLAAPLQPFCEGGCSNGISVLAEVLETAPATTTPLAQLGELWKKRQAE